MSSADQPAADLENGGGPVEHNPTVGRSSRRDMMRIAAGGAVAVGGVGAGASTASADWSVGVCEDASALNVTCGIGSATKWVFDKAGGLFSSGYSEEQVDELLAENIHIRLWQGIDDEQAFNEGFLVEFQNLVQPGDEANSPLARRIWGDIRSHIFKNLGDKTAQEIYTEADQLKNEDLAERYQNFFRQWNEVAYQRAAMMVTFVQSDVTFEEASHLEGETISEIPFTAIGEHETGLHSDTVIDTFSYGGSGDSTHHADPTEFGVSVSDYTLPTGETEPYYGVRFKTPNPDDSTVDPTILNHNPVNPSQDQTSIDDLVERSDDYIHWYGPDDGQEIGQFPAGTDSGDHDNNDIWYDLLNALEAVESHFDNELESYVSNVVQAYNEGDIEGFDILGPSDIYQEFGDNGDMSRFAAEALGMGLVAPDGEARDVTITSPDAATFADGTEATGNLYIDWEFDSLRSWEFSYDDTDHVVELDADSVMGNAVYYLQYDDSGTVNELGVNVDDFTIADDGTATYDVPDADQPAGTFQGVTVDASGELSSFIPEGETIASPYAIFGYEDDEGALQRETFMNGDEFTLVDVHALEDEDSDPTRLTLTGYNQTTRDPARALEQAEQMADRYIYTGDIEPDAGWNLPWVGDGDWVPDLPWVLIALAVGAWVVITGD